MKKVVSRSTLLIAATIAILAMTTAKAETPLMRMDIPFAFLAGEHTLPAGNYWVRVDTDFRFLELRPADGTGAQRVALAGGQFAVKKVSETNGFLRFRRYGDIYALEGAYGANSGYGLNAKPSKTEIEVAKAHPEGGAEIEVTPAR